MATSVRRCTGLAIAQHRSNRRDRVANFGVVNVGTLWQCTQCQLNREFKMSFKKASLLATLAVSMASAPVLAQTATSASSPATAEARSGADMQDANAVRV